MRPFFSSPFARKAKPPRARRPDARLAVLLLSTCFAACDRDSQDEQPERTEPWRKDQTEEGIAAQAVLSRYQVTPDQVLRFELPGRKAKPSGTLRGITGEVDVALRQLQLTRGTLRIDLTQLEMDAPAEKKSTPAKREAKETHSLPSSRSAATATAREWLGLGEDVPESERTKNKFAVFEIASLRDLSHPSAHTGARRKSEGKGQTRQVYATAEGELSLRGFSVERQLALTLSFHYSDQALAEEVPTSIEVALRPNARVPLSEYDIQPRGASGSVISEQLDLIGREVGSVATILGTIELRKVGPAGKSN